MLLQPEIHLYPTKYFLRHSQQISEQKFLLKRLLKKPSMLVWHGQNCDRSQIKTKRVGAWPLCFFFIVTYIFDVFNFSFAPSRRKKIFFWWCHTNMHGTNLRSSPLLLLGNQMIVENHLLFYYLEWILHTSINMTAEKIRNSKTPEQKLSMRNL